MRESKREREGKGRTSEGDMYFKRVESVCVRVRERVRDREGERERVRERGEGEDLRGRHVF